MDFLNMHLLYVKLWDWKISFFQDSLLNAKNVLILVAHL